MVRGCFICHLKENSIKVNGYIFRGSNSVIFNITSLLKKGQLFKDLLPCLQYKNDLGTYFMQYVQNGLNIHLTNALKNNICQN